MWSVCIHFMVLAYSNIWTRLMAWTGSTDLVTIEIKPSYYNHPFISSLTKRYNNHQKNMSVKCMPHYPQFDIVKVGFTGVCLFFLFCSKALIAQAVLACTHRESMY